MQNTGLVLYYTTNNNRNIFLIFIFVPKYHRCNALYHQDPIQSAYSILSLHCKISIIKLSKYMVDRQHCQAASVSFTLNVTKFTQVNSIFSRCWRLLQSNIFKIQFSGCILHSRCCGGWWLLNWTFIYVHPPGALVRKANKHTKQRPTPSSL